MTDAEKLRALEGVRLLRAYLSIMVGAHDLPGRRDPDCPKCRAGRPA